MLAIDAGGTMTDTFIVDRAVVHEFPPDVEGFYSGWLGRELPS